MPGGMVGVRRFAPTSENSSRVSPRPGRAELGRAGLGRAEVPLGPRSPAAGGPRAPRLGKERRNPGKGAAGSGDCSGGVRGRERRNPGTGAAGSGDKSGGVRGQERRGPGTGAAGSGEGSGGVPGPERRGVGKRTPREGCGGAGLQVQDGQRDGRGVGARRETLPYGQGTQGLLRPFLTPLCEEAALSSTGAAFSRQLLPAGQRGLALQLWDLLGEARGRAGGTAEDAVPHGSLAAAAAAAGAVQPGYREVSFTLLRVL